MLLWFSLDHIIGEKSHIQERIIFAIVQDEGIGEVDGQCNHEVRRCFDPAIDYHASDCLQCGLDFVWLQTQGISYVWLSEMSYSLCIVIAKMSHAFFMCVVVVIMLDSIHEADNSIDVYSQGMICSTCCAHREEGRLIE